MLCEPQVIKDEDHRREARTSIPAFVRALESLGLV
jgi:hypothetical protein